MAGAGVTEDFCVEVDVEICGGDKVGVKFSAEGLVDSAQDKGGIGGVGGLSGEGDFQH